MKTAMLLALALASASFGANAQDMGYTYIEGGLTRVNVDVDGIGDADFNGAALRGSAQIGVSDFYAFGGLTYTRNDDAGVDVDFSALNGGVGFRYEVGSSVDLIAELSALRLEVDSDGGGGAGDADASGGRAAIGVRAALADNFEGHVRVHYTGGGDFDGSIGGTLGAQYRFGDVWGLIAEVETGELGESVNVTGVLLGVRATF